MNFFNFFKGRVWVDEPKDYSCSFDSLEGSFYAYLFYGIRGLADACGVNETEGNSLYVYGVFYGVTRGSMYIGNDGSLNQNSC